MIRRTALSTRPRARRALPAIAASLALAAGALAGAATGAAKSAAKPAATGQLHVVATGQAFFDVQGTLVALGVLPQPSRVEVKGRPGTFRVTLDGAAQRPNRRGVVRMPGASGRLFIQSSAQVRVRILGGDMDVSFAGRGQATLTGTGTYSLNGAPAQAWPAVPVLIQPTPRRRPAPPPPPPSDDAPTTTGTTTARP